MPIHKTGSCRLCPPDRGAQLLYSMGLCYMHYWSDNRNKAAENKRNSLKKNTLESLVNQESNQNTALTLKDWFIYHINHSGRRCENCDHQLYFALPKAAYSCQAHILPKSVFPSVSTHLHNHLTLGGLFQKCTCHGQFDSNWKNAEKMPVIEIAKTRFLLFKDFISENELRRLPEPFLKLL